MPLHVARLRDSTLAAEEAPEACWYAVMLWAASWHQIPAASLPDNDAVLTRLLGLGRDVRTFARHKAGALRGFVKCTDGRLYHPVVADQALIAWTSKLRRRWTTECSRIKKANQRGGSLPTPTLEEFLQCSSTAKCPDHVLGDIDESPSGQRIQGTETGTERGTEGEDAEASSPAPADPKPISRRTYPPAFVAAWKAYPHAGGRSSKPNSLAEWRKLPVSEQAALVGAIDRMRPDAEKAFGGKGAPDMARWLKAGKHLSYPDPGSVTPEFVWKGPDWIKAEALSHPEHGKASAYLARCDWRPGGDGGWVTSHSGTIIDYLEKELGARLADQGVTVLHVAKVTS